MIALPEPLSGPAPREVPLPRAPLVRVLAQVRFPPILAIAKAESVAGFQEIIRSRYPILREEQTHMVVVGAGNPEVRSEVVWRFSDTDNEWRVSLAKDFVALETSKYDSRRDFIDRFAVILSAVEKSFNPQQVQRIGLRYVDRLTGDALTEIGRLIRTEVRGIVDSPLGKIADQLMSDARFSDDDAAFTARWGKLPANASFDPNILDPIAEPSWILDLDVYATVARPFVTANVAALAESFSEKIYRIFRWMVTDDFLIFYGGKL